MKFERIRFIAEVIGAVSIVASLIFVGLQLRQTQQSLDMARILTEMTVFQDLQNQLVENPEFAETMTKARSDSKSLTPSQRMQVLAWLENWLAEVATYNNERSAGVLSRDGLSRRMGNECWVYYDYRKFFDEIRKRRDFFEAVDEFCTKH